MTTQEKSKKARASKNKGKDGERELVNKLKELTGNMEIRRGQQFCGSNGDADVTGLNGIHIEVKRVETLRLDDALKQSIADAKAEEMPIVAHRKNRGDWIVIQPLADWVKIYEAYNTKEK